MEVGETVSEADLSKFRLPLGCLIGNSFGANYMFRIYLPAIFWAGFLILFVLFKASGRIFSYDRAINAVGKILKSIFLSLASLSMSLFRCREHPSKEATLVMFPQVIFCEPH